MARKDTIGGGLGRGGRLRLVVEGGWAEEMRKNKNKVLPLDFVR